MEDGRAAEKHWNCKLQKNLDWIKFVNNIARSGQLAMSQVFLFSFLVIKSSDKWSDSNGGRIVAWMIIIAVLEVKRGTLFINYIAVRQRMKVFVEICDNASWACSNGKRIFVVDSTL